MENLYAQKVCLQSEMAHGFFAFLPNCFDFLFLASFFYLYHRTYDIHSIRGYAVPYFFIIRHGHEPVKLCLLSAAAF